MVILNFFNLDLNVLTKMGCIFDTSKEFKGLVFFHRNRLGIERKGVKKFIPFCFPSRFIIHGDSFLLYFYCLFELIRKQ
jgi:hypothetical protein